ncbi:hypothetical protein C8R48DRAFT_680313 [Suillus tomentosus]|nr:hypothetical protein C8R48DRAFT_680313 [Suillus tomentosus]
MPTITRGQASKSLIIKRRTAQMMREQRMNDRLKTLNEDAPFRGTRSGRHALQMPPVANARQPQINDPPRPNMTDLNSEYIPIDVRLEQASRIKIEPSEEKIGGTVKIELIDQKLGASLKIEPMDEKMAAIVKIEPIADDKALLIVKIEEEEGVIVKIEDM